MPRNSSGVYSLPAGNPVVTGTTISSSWANSTLADLATAMTDSLSRSGDGAMLAPLLLDDGAIGAPALSWGNETTSGLYRAGAGDFRYAIGGADKVQFTTNGILTTDGALGTPSFSFISDPDNGMYRVGANNIRLVAGGVSIIDMLATGATVLLANGLVGTPSLTFQTDPNTGVYSLGADYFGITVGGVLGFDVRNLAGAIQIHGPNGTAVNPTYSFDTDYDTGIYRFGANTMAFSTGGTARATLDNNQWNFADGSVGLPVLAFSNDPDTGIYRIGANQLGIGTNGVNRMQIDTTGIYHRINSYAIDGLVATPGYAFENDPDSGIFRNNTSGVCIAYGSQQVASFFGGTNSIIVLGATASSFLEINMNTGATATAGGGAAIPATVTGFLNITINGSARRIPYYNP